MLAAKKAEKEKEAAKKFASMSLDILKGPLLNFEKALNAQRESLDNYTIQTTELLLTKVKKMMREAADAFLSGDKLDFDIKEVKQVQGDVLRSKRTPLFYTARITSHTPTVR